MSTKHASWTIEKHLTHYRIMEPGARAPQVAECWDLLTACLIAAAPSYHDAVENLLAEIAAARQRLEPGIERALSRLIDAHEKARGAPGSPKGETP